MRARILVTALATAIVGACASNGSGGTPASVPGNASASTQASAPSRGSRNPDLISEAEIAERARDAATALAIVEKLRPQMLRSRGATSTRETSGDETLPRVYVDDVSFGPINSLGNLASGQVKEIRFIKGPDATTRWGTGHMAGVILVTTKK